MKMKKKLKTIWMKANTYTPQHTRDATNHQRHTYNIVVHTDTYIYLMHIVNSTNVDGWCHKHEHWQWECKCKETGMQRKSNIWYNNPQKVNNSEYNIKTENEHNRGRSSKQIVFVWFFHSKYVIKNAEIRSYQVKTVMLIRHHK